MPVVAAVHVTVTHARTTRSSPIMIMALKIDICLCVPAAF